MREPAFILSHVVASLPFQIHVSVCRALREIIHVTRQGSLAVEADANPQDTPQELHAKDLVRQIARDFQVQVVLGSPGQDSGHELRDGL
jgi:hypothetical protein